MEIDVHTNFGSRSFVVGEDMLGPGKIRNLPPALIRHLVEIWIEFKREPNHARCFLRYEKVDHGVSLMGYSLIPDHNEYCATVGHISPTYPTDNAILFLHDLFDARDEPKED